MHALKNFIFSLVFSLLLLVLLSSCTDTPPEATQTNTPEVTAPTQTPDLPSPTPIPAAAVVNGERLPLRWFENELAQYLIAQEAAGQPVEDIAEARTYVLDDLVDQFLLAQAAQDAGISIEDDEVQDRIENLRAELDLDSWMQEWGYTNESLAQSLKWQMLAIKQRDEIIKLVPERAMQVELQQIFAYTETGARNAVGSLNAGTPFEEVVFVYDPAAGGYLGWVPEGYLLIPALEEAAFSLPVGEYSGIIESDIGYHIVKVLAREERPLSQDALLTLQRQALHAWLADKRESSTIEVLID
ncbi:MAG: SurA N-terminal domain-containing protein [Brevefilum sp.]|nr:SurA N-terminal domain-containing protein [Brevefilum sp.]MDT8381531.1 SurA N-terminal domain-containing protein [Brevefilum sp.]MDW7754436.1 SurA N-terminal domain-containing protein [Brevefilum sp.]